MVETLALYTFIHKGAVDYLPSWYKSVQEQTDKDFDLWITVNELEAEEVIEVIGSDVKATWLSVATGETPVQARQLAIEKMSDNYDAIVFVDADDCLEATRIESAKRALVDCDVSGCAMRIIDQLGHDTGLIFRPSPDSSVEDILINNNVFGMGNTIYKTDVIRQCLPIPPKCMLMDWFIATRALSVGASIKFDYNIGMAYRQYESNTARILTPFNKEYIIYAAQLVNDHYDLLLSSKGIITAGLHDKLLKACQNVSDFRHNMVGTEGLLDKYMRALNDLSPNYVWWSCVAHPNLEKIWKN